MGDVDAPVGPRARTAADTGTGPVEEPFDILTSVRVLGPDEPAVTSELVEALLDNAVRALDGLADLDPSELDDEALTRWAEGTERIRRMADATAIGVADHIDGADRFRAQGFFTASKWLKHRLQLSGPEAHGRVQAARMARRVPVWRNAETAGIVGVAQMRLMGRVAANPRIADEVLQRDRWELLDDAMDLPYDSFERNVRTWESLADPDGAASEAERNRSCRDVTVTPRPDGGWSVDGSLDGVGGAEFNEILAHFIEAEWRADWSEANERVGNEATVADLARTEPQRRADALLAMARAAATNAGGSHSVPTVNLLIDAETFEATLRGESIDTRRYRDMTCRTEAGHRLHPDDVVNAALWAHIRRVVHDASSVVIDLGRRSRVFIGAAREAVMLLEETCVWVGCDQPAAWCQADHSVGWAAHGATVPRNGGPLCGRHNRLKEHGFRVFRDDAGNWHIIDPVGDEIT